jgi:hypothetical protein
MAVGVAPFRPARALGGARAAAIALAVVLPGLAIAPRAAAAPDRAGERLLRRSAPILRYDSHERYRATVVEALTSRRLDERGRPSDRIALRARAGGPDAVYGHAVKPGAGRIWLQYWLLYAANPQDRGIVRTGRHEGDWEVVEVELAHGSPQRTVFAQHAWAEACAWAAVERRGEAPVVYVANGSHASHPHAGEHGRPWPDPDDEADGAGATVRPRVRVVGDAAPAWVRWPGRWGRSDGGAIPGEKASPRGPAFQADGPWRDPDGYLERALACGSGAPPLPWAVRLGAGALAAALSAAGAAWVLQRRRGDPSGRPSPDPRPSTTVRR